MVNSSFNHIAFIGLGSNLHNPLKQVLLAIDAINHYSSINILAKSCLYKTKPYGNTEQDDFINAVIKIETSLSCFELLNIIKVIELEQKRERTLKWGPRTIDLDILAYNKEIFNTPDLKVPHPDLHNRVFVLKPWCEIDANWKLPDNSTIKNLYQNLINNSNKIDSSIIITQLDISA